MTGSTLKLYRWQDCAAFDIKTVQQLYREYVNASQVELIGSFGFGRTCMTRAEGMYIYTADGRKILDFTGGVGVLNHGHNHPRILKVRRDFEAPCHPEVHKNFLSQYVAGLSHNVAQIMPGDLNISYFCNSGAEAVEGAVKLAYKYHGGNRNTILHADISFHGKLLGTGGLTGSPELHFHFPTIPGIYPFIYDNIDSVKTLVAKCRDKKGESTIYAIIVEGLNASSLRECSTAFLSELREICTRENIVLIFDEVYTGWAKTGRLFYFMHHNVIPDIVTYAKSFGGGKASIAGYTTRTPFFRKAYDNLNDATLHSTTYNGFGEETVTAIEAVNIIIEEDYPSKAQRIYDRLHPGLLKIQAKYPDLIREVRGCGALNGILLNDEINPVLKKAISFIPGDVFRDERLITKLVNGSVISELYNNHDVLTFFAMNRELPLIISPSLVATDDDIDYFLHALDRTLAVGKFNLILKFAKFKFSR